MTSLAPLVAIVGPTASGKSALGIWLAERLDGEIVACDSTQVYRRFDIGTAKVPAAEQRGIAHHLVDLLEPQEVFTAGEYRLRALAVLEELRARRKLPILTVGTGLYLRALLEGLSDAPTRSEELRERLRQRANARGAAYLHRILARLDASAAARIAPQDEPKTIRAIEVRILSGKSISAAHRAGRRGLQGFHAIKIGLQPPRAALYARIERRVQVMVEQGWLAEVERLLAQGVPGDAKPFQFIGYSELRAHLEGGRSLDEAVASIQQATRRYAKRQITWFRKEPGVRWFENFSDDAQIRAAALGYLEEQLAAAFRFSGQGAL